MQRRIQTPEQVPHVHDVPPVQENPFSGHSRNGISGKPGAVERV
jgi:hypothetical protein